MEASFEFVTPSEVVEYCYCPRFVYFMNVLKLDQHEHRRFLVNKGRDIHEHKLVTNKDYIRKRIGCIKKELDVYLTSEKLRLVGKVDEVLFFSDLTASPLDYKYAFWDEKLYTTYQIQQTLYALLIEEVYQMEVNQAFLVFVRSKNHLYQFEVNNGLKEKALLIVNEVLSIINDGYYPNVKPNHNKCEDCTYRNICSQ